MSLARFFPSAGRLRVACGQGTILEVLELQLEGRKRLPARDFLNGVRPSPGEKLGRICNRGHLLPISPARTTAYRILRRVEAGRGFAVDLLQTPGSVRAKGSGPATGDRTRDGCFALARGAGLPDCRGFRKACGTP